jgi:asparagine synthase (glutamine-hydrolysing)
MSVQFGKCDFGRKPVDPKQLDQIRAFLAPYGPDGEGSFWKDNVAILYRAFRTTRESHSEVQPHVSTSGAVITWDGRLDNRQELTGQLAGKLSAGSTDLSVVAEAYERWGTDCFAKLIGDWAVSIWDPRDRSVVLARDFVGTRHLFYSVESDRVTWSTILDPLVLFAGRSFAVEEEYVAGWLSFLPAPHLTPYVEIRSVPPSCFVRLAKGASQITRYWDFDPARRTRYRTDAEYEEHFRTVFAESVRRRLRSDSPILAELSGGMDSSSIVCTADTIMGRGEAETPRLDTVSFYDDSEPNWDERPYFTKVEQKRGCTGLHIDVSSRESLILQIDKDRFEATPACSGHPTEGASRFAACMASQGNRVVLSGVGGDEVTGGVPTPTPELADLLARGRLGTLAHQLRVWALNKRRPWLHLLSETVRLFLPPGLGGSTQPEQPPVWLHPNLVRRQRKALCGYESRLRLFGPMPSLQESLCTLDMLRRQLGCQPVSLLPLTVKRYSYLDRDLLEFLYAIPREQLVRPGQRRSLMRRALVGIVPDEVLQRKRKAYVSRRPMVAVSAVSSELIEMSRDMVSVELGFVVQSEFVRAVQQIASGFEGPLIPLMRTIALELWLRNLQERALLQCPGEQTRELRISPVSHEYGGERILS